MNRRFGRLGGGGGESELGLNEGPLSSRSNAVPTSSHFKIFFGFFLDSKRHDLGVH
jgi:hypothetical protein